MEPEIKNVRRCTICGGSVDKYPHHMECSECGAIADLMTGIFTPRIEFKLPR